MTLSCVLICSCIFVFHIVVILHHYNHFLCLYSYMQTILFNFKFLTMILRALDKSSWSLWGFPGINSKALAGFLVIPGNFMKAQPVGHCCTFNPELHDQFYVFRPQNTTDDNLINLLSSPKKNDTFSCSLSARKHI